MCYFVTILNTFTTTKLNTFFLISFTCTQLMPIICKARERELRVIKSRKDCNGGRLNRHYSVSYWANKPTEKNTFWLKGSYTSILKKDNSPPNEIPLPEYFPERLHMHYPCHRLWGNFLRKRWAGLSCLGAAWLTWQGLPSEEWASPLLCLDNEYRKYSCLHSKKVLRMVYIFNFCYNIWDTFKA